MQKVTIHAPATVANLVCGFDILGMALEAPYDIMEVRLLEEPGVIITSKDGFPLPADPAKNTAGAPLLEMLQDPDPAKAAQYTRWRAFRATLIKRPAQ